MRSRWRWMSYSGCRRNSATCAARRCYTPRFAFPETGLVTLIRREALSSLHLRLLRHALLASVTEIREDCHDVQKNVMYLTQLRPREGLTPITDPSTYRRCCCFYACCLPQRQRLPPAAARALRQKLLLRLAR
ncbi:hypothetical protein GUJ93_ZPchr0001g32577 [Zizania palustris]|uniref:Uncharacterized protein n=1 Tax=Zizania palustris TaxID=103762 RepID=A0A8J5RMX8_ZIZPA|nr:hypothetical protein GUJ93_ZPchr0001g32577 [Zizania palustris]